MAQTQAFVFPIPKTTDDVTAQMTAWETSDPRDSGVSKLILSCLPMSQTQAANVTNKHTVK